MSASASGPKEAIDAINACDGLTTPQKAAARDNAIREAKFAQGIVDTPAAERTDTLAALKFSAPGTGQLHSVAQRLVDRKTAAQGC